MISFWRQLVFLLWKNILIKWRQKFWLSVELILPLVLFILLALVRLQDFTEEYQLCHYDSKALPSAGVLPFIESLSCTILNDCRSEPKESITFKESPLIVDVLYQIASQLREFGKNTTQLDKAVGKLAGSIIYLTEYNYTEMESIPLTELSRLTESELTEFIKSMNVNRNASKILASSSIKTTFLLKLAEKMGDVRNLIECTREKCIGKLMGLCEVREFEQHFITSERMSQEDLDSICQLSHLAPSFSTYHYFNLARGRQFGPRMVNFVKITEVLLQLDTSISWARNQPLGHLEKWITRLNSEKDLNDALMCGKDPQKLVTEAIKIEKKKADTLMNRLLKNLYNFITTIRAKDSQTVTVKKCGKLTFKDSTCPLLNVPLYGEKTKPLLKGYILVTPDSPATRRLVKRLEEPFKLIEILLKSIPHFAVELKHLQKRLYTSEARQLLLKFLKLVDENALIRDNLPKEFSIWRPILEKIYSQPDNLTSPAAIFGQFAEKLAIGEECFTLDRFRFVEDEEELEKTAVCLQDEQQYLTGLVFENATGNHFDSTVTYKIRHVGKMIDDTVSWRQKRWDWRRRDQPLDDLKYLTFGFVFLQEAVDRAIIEEMTGRSPSLGVHVQQHPIPCFLADTFIVANFYMLCVILSYIVPSALLVKNIVLEKEQKLKEQMRIMGLGDSVHFISWALVAMAGCCVTVLLISFISRTTSVLVKTEIIILTLWLGLYAFSCIMLSLFISTWFTNANKAVAMSTVVTFVFMFPAMFSQRFDSKYFTLASLAFPQSALIYSGWIICFADMASGVKLSNWLEHGDYDKGIFLWQCFFALFVDAFFYWGLAWYTSAIFPGTFGVSQPWYFPFTRHYWCRTTCPKFDANEKSESKVDLTQKEEVESDSDRFEKETSSSSRATVKIETLSKEYNDGTIALTGLSLNLYENQITAMLGHNGAGKTTSMSMLCGLYEPSSGTAVVYGRDLRLNMRGVREVLGFCPQQNVLFPLLTIHEQLRFFAALKGTPINELHQAADEILEAMNLTEKADCLAGSLSGGQKRRLSIGIALIGGSKFVILDEPTAGVDVNNRKDIWRLLQENKKGRTILLSTHHMNEADVLADRVAVLSEGKLVSCGSPVFLKKNFGQNMQLIACKTEKEADYAEIIRQIEEKSPLGGKIKMKDSNDAEVIFSIPVTVDSHQLEKFFVWFEEKADQMKFADYGITEPSLQDIFIRLAPQNEYKVVKRARWWQRCFLRKKEVIMENDKSSQSSVKTDFEYEFDLPEQVTGWSRLAIHIRALLFVKTKYIQRNFKVVFFQIILPLLLISSAELYSKLKLKGPLTSAYEAPPPLPLFTRLASRFPDSFISQMGGGEIQGEVMNQMVQSQGMGAICLDKLPKYWWDHLSVDSNCYNDSKGIWNWTRRFDTEKTTPSCACRPKANWNCTVEDYPLARENLHVILNTSDRVWDLTGRNLSELLLVAYSSSSGNSSAIEFMGGFSADQNWRAFTPDAIEEAIRGWRWLREFTAKWNISEPAVGQHFTEGLHFWPTTERIFKALETKDNLLIWFNNRFLPSLPAYQNVLSNALLRVMSPNQEVAGIMTVQHPMKHAASEQFDETKQAVLVMFRILLIFLVLCTIPAGFSSFLVEDRVSGSFHMQLVSGLAKRTYWLTTYFFDISLYLAGATILLLIYYLFGVGEFCHTFRTFFSFLTLFSLYGCSAILWSYIIQRWFTVSSLAFILISVGTFFIGSVTSLMIFFLQSLIDKTPTMEIVHQVCSTVFLIFPQYNLGMAVMQGSLSYLIAFRGEKFLKETNRMDLVDQLPIPIEWELMGNHLLYLGLHILPAALIFFLLEHGTFSYLQKIEQIKAAAEKTKEHLEEDEDVLAEKERVSELEEDDESCPLVVQGLLKRFKRTGLAVKGVTFAVEAGECFGLLGINGAGKSTCFNILTGNIYASGGTVRIGDVLVEQGRTNAFSQVGYCPQFDALNVHLTTRENLTLFARIRSLPESSIQPLTDRLLKALHLYPYAKALTGALSGGNKRKLSVAIALISQPSLILLDEPSAGMDPGSQQFLWKVIEELRKSGKAVVITSHSMEECEALCTRIAIMDRGYMRCLGSKQHLKNKFGEGYSLILKLVSSESYEEDVTEINRLVQAELPQATLEAVHCVTLFYKIKKGENLSVGAILQAVNRIKKQIRLEDFSLSQATLDDVFSRLEKNQDE